MQTTFQLIEIVSNPVNKNCWLAVEEYPELKTLFSDFIQYYDFIDFEGNVFYYNSLNKLPINDAKAFVKRYSNINILSKNEGLDVFLEVLSQETQQIVLSHFVEGNTIVLFNK